MAGPKDYPQRRGQDQEGQAKAGMGVAAEDLDGDGDLDLLVGNLTGESDSLFRNELSVDDFKQLVHETRGFLQEVPRQTKATSSEIRSVTAAVCRRRSGPRPSRIVRAGKLAMTPKGSTLTTPASRTPGSAATRSTASRKSAICFSGS